MDIEIYLLAAAVTGGFLGLAHFALHPEVTGSSLPRVWAYIIGVGVIGTVTTVLGLRYATTPAQVVALFWVCVWSGAVMTLGGRLIRRWFDGQHAIAERDELMRRRRGND